MAPAWSNCLATLPNAAKNEDNLTAMGIRITCFSAETRWTTDARRRGQWLIPPREINLKRISVTCSMMRANVSDSADVPLNRTDPRHAGDLLNAAQMSAYSSGQSGSRCSPEERGILHVVDRIMSDRSLWRA
jgi:hypothetical protein